MRAIFLLLVSLVYLAGCESNSSEPPSTDVPSGLMTDLPIDILGVERNYHLFVPRRPKTAPIVVLLHGNRGSSNQLLGLPLPNLTNYIAPNKIWLDIAQRENLILIVPNGSVGREGFQGWNDCRSDAPNNPETDDVLFIGKLIEEVSDTYQGTENRVYSVGISNGGMMSMRLADELSENLHAFAAVVASRPVNSKCMENTLPISALIMNGTADPILPYEGGHIRPRRGELYSTLDTVSYWVNRNQTNTNNEVVELEDIEREDNSVAKVYSYSTASFINDWLVSRITILKRQKRSGNFLAHCN